MGQSGDQETSFGFRTVKTGEKARLVRSVFDSVASKYDLMNDLMSGGVHRIWKSVMLDRIAPMPGEALIDVAGGTGDIAAGFLKRADERPSAGTKPPATAVVCDINYEMLKAGEARADMARYGERLTRVTGDAEDLPFPDKSFDAYTIAFGIRNVTDMEAALREAWRVLKPGGRFFCLEFSHMATEGLQKIYDAYSFNVIPKLGEMVADDRESYQYLVESIRRFPAQEAFAAKIRAAGFARVKYENLTAGVAAIHSGWRV
ncbi:bifunctional demethylmenaquinone methyltransferase/2-methoxy-6-polyprenyl-1,4-benzoquinol methylase UbiE [Hyphococcus luteus]|uniref:Ubiquinone/menaquinone biosynthesis C-methyltransferase UbiE n=1 Tax=Hyphococcus luteus TaxID=2058213 RepID=A0A2S7K6J2_9PROT|nr:bifunctional demethylmenaquinone methyltransferase/2-methoxy-6-polyprenyl-1,4-benzoquinol methylase UbiE [Marinicaulis flavus]PQA88078.1 bifunctional demethylmenaquinone methyltransferase/2-methoxy-6-polyprenyl-1,4-benzoquinol methylase UbiE [Marinicaulis flavus]